MGAFFVCKGVKTVRVLETPKFLEGYCFVKLINKQILVTSVVAGLLTFFITQHLKKD